MTARPLAACAALDPAGCRLVVWARSDPPLSREAVLQAAAALAPLRCWVTTHPWHWLPEAATVQVDIRERDYLAAQGSSGRTPSPVVGNALVRWSPDVPPVVLLRQPSVYGLCHEVCHVLGLGHRNEPGYLTSGKVRPTDPWVPGGFAWHPVDFGQAWTTRQAYVKHWFETWTNYPFRIPGKTGWDLVTGPVLGSVGVGFAAQPADYKCHRCG